MLALHDKPLIETHISTDRDALAIKISTVSAAVSNEAETNRQCQACPEAFLIRVSDR